MDLNSYALDFQIDLEQQIEHFMDTEVYRNKIYQEWRENFFKNDVIQTPSENQNWYMIWLEKHLVEQQVYCDDLVDLNELKSNSDDSFLNEENNIPT